MFVLPEKKRKAIIHVFKHRGQRWVDRYPDLMLALVHRWKLTLDGIATAGLPINIIHYGKTESGQAVALKVGVPHPEQKTELMMLQHYNGRHAVKLIDWDEASGAFLMERILPGTQLRDYENVAERSQVRLDLIARLPLPLAPKHQLPTIETWFDEAFVKFRGSSEPNPEFLSFIELAEEGFAVLKGHYQEPYLLHGDLHHENILWDAKRGWIAIDPKGVIGPKIMECGRFLQNFIEDEVPGVAALKDATESQVADVLVERFSVVSEITGFSTKHLSLATYIDQVLSSCWSVNAGQSVDHRKIRIIRDLAFNI